MKGKRKTRSEEKSEEMRSLRLDRKSPPFVRFAKDGAPSRSFGRQPLIEWKANHKQPRSKLFHAVVGGFLGDDHVVDVGFTEAGSGDADEAAFFGEFGDGARADVTHTALQAAD